jgi:hypothetical protein
MKRVKHIKIKTGSKNITRPNIIIILGQYVVYEGLGGKKNSKK